jgi:ABC-type polar amino acid transport system ATPase subunit
MVFQSFNLFPHLTVLENCTLAPIWVRRMPKHDAEALAMSLLTRVKIPEQAAKYPGQLSGGQQQRVAIARALVGRPEVLLADEPTGNLDSRTSVEIMGLFQELNDANITVVMVTHELDVAAYCKRVVVMRDGQIISDVVNQTRRSAREELAALDQAEQKANLS